MPRSNSKRSYYVVLLLILFVALGYLIFLSPYFQISKIQVNDLKYLEKTKVEKEILDFKNDNLLNKNIITFSSSALNKKLIASGGVENSKTKKIYPNQIKVEIVEKTPIFVWETGNKKFLIDEKGRVSADYEEKFKDLPLVVDTKNVPLDDNKQVVSATFSTFIKDLGKDFQVYTEAKINRIEVPEITSEIKVYTDASWHACFDTTRTAKGQLVNLSRILSESKSKKKKLEYIDLRIDNRIFYK